MGSNVYKYKTIIRFSTVGNIHFEWGNQNELALGLKRKFMFHVSGRAQQKYNTIFSNGLWRSDARTGSYSTHSKRFQSWVIPIKKGIRERVG